MRYLICLIGLAVAGVVFGGEVRGETFEEGDRRLNEIRASGCFVVDPTKRNSNTATARRGRSIRVAGSGQTVGH